MQRRAAKRRNEEGSVPEGLAAPFQGECRFLVSLDYDGTLRSDAGPTIAPAFLELMLALRPLGVRWGINTGRNLPYLLGDFPEKLPVLPDFICTCERYVYMADSQGKLQPAHGHNAMCMQANLELRKRFTPVLHAALDGLRASHPELEWCIAVTDPLSLETPDAAAMDALVPYISHLTPIGATIQRAGRYLRFSDSRYSKGTALRYVSQQWGVPGSNLFIMGDGHNDLDAFQLFPEAFCAAPADAHPEVSAWLRLHGGYVSPETGVIAAIRHWINERGNRPA